MGPTTSKILNNLTKKTNEQFQYEFKNDGLLVGVLVRLLLRLAVINYLSDEDLVGVGPVDV